MKIRELDQQVQCLIKGRSKKKQRRKYTGKNYQTNNIRKFPLTEGSSQLKYP